MNDRPLLSIPEVAIRLGVSRMTVQRRVTDGSLAAVRVGGQIRIDPADLDAYIDRHKTGGGGAA